VAFEHLDLEAVDLGLEVAGDPYLVIAAVRARGGRVTVAGDVFLPQALRATLA